MSNHAAPQPGPAEGRQPIGPAAAALALLLAALWGANPVAVKYSVDTIPPIAVSALRFVMAAAFMLLWCRAEGSDLRMRPGQWRPTLVLGLILFVQIVLFTVGIHLTNASHATLLINAFIFFVAGIEHFVTRTDRLSPRRFAGLVIAGAGVVLVLAMTGGAGSSSPDAAADAPSLTGDLMLFASAVLLAVKIIYTKQAVRTVEPGKLILWHDVVGVVLFTATSLAFEEIGLEAFTLPAVLGLFYQGVVVAGFCFAAQAALLRRHSASQVSVFGFATPLFGIVFAVLLRGETVSPWLLVSGACVALGIVLVNRRVRERDGTI